MGVPIDVGVGGEGQKHVNRREETGLLTVKRMGQG